MLNFGLGLSQISGFANNGAPKKMLRTSIKRAMFVIVLLGCVACAIYYHEIEKHRIIARYRYDCPMHLTDLWSLTLTFAEGNDHFPEDLTFITKKTHMSREKMRLRLSPVLCPASKAPINLNEKTGETPDYAYVNWSSRFPHLKDVPEDYPLAYDRTLANHGGRGIFIVMVNGRIIWDADAQWIRNFSTLHPEYLILIPK